MDILIKDMEMPKGKPICIIIDPAGQVRHYDLNNDKYTDDELFEAVPVPPHGDLIERDEPIERAWRLNLYAKELIKMMLTTAPTIIPADGKDIKVL